MHPRPVLQRHQGRRNRSRPVHAADHLRLFLLAVGYIFSSNSPTESELAMGFSYNPAVRTFPIRSGVERATLVRRTYALVFASIVVTMLGAGFAVTQPSLFTAGARHPLPSFIFALVPFFIGMRNHPTLPHNPAFSFPF